MAKKQIKITQIKSRIGYSKKAKATLDALGIRKMNKSFIHLRCLSSYSLSESTLKIKKLVNLAKQNNMPALAIVDNNNMFGVLEFAIEASQNGIQPIIGTSINFLDINGASSNTPAPYISVSSFHGVFFVKTIATH